MLIVATGKFELEAAALMCSAAAKWKEELKK